jgi:ABC-type Na+ efflux pump permease subunit
MSRGLGLRGIAWIAAAGTLLQVPFWILTWDWWKDLRNHQAAVGFELYLVGLGATIAAVSSVVQEKESKSMEILLTAPVQPRAIAWGKFYALALSLCALLAMPLAHVCFFAAIGYLSLATPVAFVALVPGAMAFFVAQGLYLSVIARQLVSAQVAGLLAYHAWLVAGAVCPCLLFFLPSMLGWFVAFGIAPGPRLEVFTGLVWWGRLDQGPIFLAILAIPALIITGLILTRLLESAGLRLRPSAKRR